MKSLILIAVSLLAVVGCGDPTPDRGIVVGKAFEPEREYVTFLPIPITTSNGRTTQTTFIFMPWFVRDDADYMLSVEYESDAKLCTSLVYVPSQMFDTTIIGGMFCKNGDCSGSDPVEKIRRASDEEATGADTMRDPR